MGFDRPIDGVEKLVAAARVDVVSATRSVLRRGLAQTFTPPPPDFPPLSPPRRLRLIPAGPILSHRRSLCVRPKFSVSLKDALRRASHVPHSPETAFDHATPDARVLRVR